MGLLYSAGRFLWGGQMMDALKLVSLKLVCYCDSTNETHHLGRNGVQGHVGAVLMTKGDPCVRVTLDAEQLPEMKVGEMYFVTVEKSG